MKPIDKKLPLDSAQKVKDQVLEILERHKKHTAFAGGYLVEQVNETVFAIEKELKELWNQEK